MNNQQFSTEQSPELFSRRDVLRNFTFGAFLLAGAPNLDEVRASSTTRSELAKDSDLDKIISDKLYKELFNNHPSLETTRGEFAAALKALEAISGSFKVAIRKNSDGEVEFVLNAEDIYVKLIRANGPKEFSSRSFSTEKDRPLPSMADFGQYGHDLSELTKNAYEMLQAGDRKSLTNFARYFADQIAAKYPFYY